MKINITMVVFFSLPSLREYGVIRKDCGETRLASRAVTKCWPFPTFNSVTKMSPAESYSTSEASLSERW